MPKIRLIKNEAAGKLDPLFPYQKEYGKSATKAINHLCGLIKKAGLGKLYGEPGTRNDTHYPDRNLYVVGDDGNKYRICKVSTTGGRFILAGVDGNVFRGIGRLPGPKELEGDGVSELLAEMNDYFDKKIAEIKATWDKKGVKPADA